MNDCPTTLFMKGKRLTGQLRALHAKPASAGFCFSVSMIFCFDEYE